MTRRKAIDTCQLCLRASRNVSRRVYSSEPVKPPPDEPGPSSSRLDGREALRRLHSRTLNATKALNDRSFALRKEVEHRLVEISSRFSQMTGYEHIESLKRQVDACESALLAARAAAREAKEIYETASEARRTSQVHKYILNVNCRSVEYAQRKSNDLLQRKSSWTETDVSRFTELVRRDHVTENEMKDARRALSECEESVEKGFSALMNAILARYHEEQVWSDKIRSVSTYGSLAITAANVLVFLLAVIVVEPWRRNRLIAGVEHRLHERELTHASRSEESIAGIIDRLAVAEAKLDETLARIIPPPSRAASAERPSPLPDLGAVLKELMEADEADVMEERPRGKDWRDTAVAGVGGMLVGALAVAAILWR